MALTKRLLIVQMTTGDVVSELPPSSLKWATRLNKNGTIDVDVRISADDVDEATVRRFTKPKKFGLALVEGDNILEAGHITSRTFADDGASVSVSAVGIWTYLEWVKVFSPDFDRDSGDPRTDQHTIDGTLGHIARQLVRNSMDNIHDAWHTIPIITISDTEVGTNTRTYYGKDFASVAERLQQLISVQHGPDIEFTPEFTDATQTHIHWVMRTGGKANPLLMQVGEPHPLDLTVSKGTVTSLGVDEDGTDISTRVWTLGAGSDTDQGIATGVNSLLESEEYPLLEAKTRLDVNTPDVLIAHMLQATGDASSTLSTWTLSLQLDAAAAYQPGDFVQVWTEGYSAVTDGKHLCRVVGLDGDHTGAVKLAIQPTLTTWEDFDPMFVPRRYIDPDPQRVETTTSVSYGIGGGAGKLATIADPYEIGGRAKVIFDGTTETTTEGFTWLDPYMPKAGDRVAMATFGNELIIVGRYANTYYVYEGSAEAVDPTSPLNPVALEEYGAFRVSKSSSNWVSLGGKLGGTNGPNMGISEVGTIPGPYRPQRRVRVQVASSNNLCNVYESGRVSISASGYLLASLGEVTYNISPLVTAMSAEAAVGNDTEGLCYLIGISTELVVIPDGFRPNTSMQVRYVDALSDAAALGTINPDGTTTIPANAALDHVHWEAADSVMSWQALPLLNGWTGSLEAALRPDGMVVTRGFVSGGLNGTTAAQYPVLFRPQFAFDRFEAKVKANGEILPYDSATGAGFYHDLHPATH
jgi:hypothetical protein